jgi:hypothetical protein
VDGGARKPQERTYRARMPYADWAGVRRDLITALEELGDREFLILGEPTPDVEPPRRGLFGRRTPPAPTRYVQVLRLEQVLSAECVGAASLGGTWHMSEPTIQQLRGLGWLTALESRVEYGNVTPNFELYVDLEASDGLPDVLVASLAILRALPESLVLESSGGAVQQVG